MEKDTQTTALPANFWKSFPDVITSHTLSISDNISPESDEKVKSSDNISPESDEKVKSLDKIQELGLSTWGDLEKKFKIDRSPSPQAPKIDFSDFTDANEEEPEFRQAGIDATLEHIVGFLEMIDASTLALGNETLRRVSAMETRMLNIEKKLDIVLSYFS